MPTPNGARALLGSLVDHDVSVCFANPGTSEMHFVAALDDVPELRGILTLFEGVATGAADGYGRVAGRPAATLLHLGPGLGNGLANLHNARRARTPIVNIVGDHATYHHRYDAPLESDLAAIARAVSGWFRVAGRPGDIAADAADAVAAACGPPGRVATLVLPADVSWSDLPVGDPEGRATRVPGHRSPVPPGVIEDAARVLADGTPTVVLLGGSALRPSGLVAAQRVADATGATVLTETFPANLARGAGLPAFDRLAYLAEFAEAQLRGARHLVLVDAARPASFFAYPGRPSDLVPDGCTVLELSAPDQDATAALSSLADALGAPPRPGRLTAAGRPDRPTGMLTAETLALAVGALLPERAIVVDEANTGGLFLPGATVGAPRHDWLTLTGGAIGQGLPVATGAAVAAPDRKVLCLEADGSAMYTIQSLWTQARESLDVTTVVLANRSYALLNLELERVGADGGGPRASAMLDLAGPELDFVALARGMGVPASRATTGEELFAQLERALGEPGPALIEARLPAGFG